MKKLFVLIACGIPLLSSLGDEAGAAINTNAPYRVTYSIVNDQMVTTTNAVKTASALVCTMSSDGDLRYEPLSEYMARNKPKMIMTLADGTIWMYRDGQFVAIKSDDGAAIYNLIRKQ